MSARDYLRALRAAVRAVERAREALERIDGDDRASLHAVGSLEFQRVDETLSRLAVRAEHVTRTAPCPRCGGFGTIVVATPKPDVQACPAACDFGRVAPERPASPGARLERHDAEPREAPLLEVAPAAETRDRGHCRHENADPMQAACLDCGARPGEAGRPPFPSVVHVPTAGHCARCGHTKKMHDATGARVCRKIVGRDHTGGSCCACPGFQTLREAARGGRP